MKGSSISSSYKAYKLKLNGSSSSKQILCALDKDGQPSSSSLKINWEDDTELNIQKDDEFGKPIKGAKFTIGKAKGILGVNEVVKTVTTDEHGEFNLKLEPGTYYIQETSVPSPFVRDRTVKEVTLEKGDSKTVTLVNRHQTGDLFVKKLDDWTQVPLKGAIYKLTNVTPIYFYNVNIEDFEPDPDLEGQLGKDDVIDDDILDDMSKDEPTKVNAGDFTYSFYANDPETGEVAVINNLPIGKYKLEEIKAPVGYALSKVVKEIEIKYDSSRADFGANTRTDVTVTDNRVLGEITTTKVSSSTGTTEPVADAKLINAKFGCYAKNNIVDPSNGSIIYKAGDLISKKTIGNKIVGDDGIKTIQNENAQLIWKNLPLGIYKVKELEAPEGYKLNDESQFVDLTVETENNERQIIKESISISDDPKTSVLGIKKVAAKQGLSSVAKPEEGIHFYVVASKYVKQYGSIEEAWKHRDEFVAKNVECDELITDLNGYAKSHDLAYGDYSLKQMSSGEGTLDMEGIFEISLRPESEETEYREYVITNFYYESFVRLIKKDLKTGKNVSFNGATFKIFDVDKNEYVTQKVGPFEYDTFTTNSDNYVAIKGIWSNIDDILGTTMAPLKLSYGHYRVEEIKTPQGYLELDEPVRFEVSKDQNIFEVTGDNENPVIEVVIKNDRPTGKIILNKTFEESTIDVGELNAKFKLTALNDVIDPADGSILYKAGDTVKDEIYSIDENGQIVIEGLSLGLDGASYQLEEIETNDSYALLDKPVVFDFTIKDNKTKEYTVEKDVTNGLIEIHTTATGDSGSHENQVSKEMTITDKVEHTGLHVGTEYTVKGKLMDQLTGEPLLVDGQEIVAEKTFTATKSNETVELTFTLDASALVGTSTVVFEDLYKDDKLIAVHRDIHDKDQTVKFIDIHTTATAEGEKVIEFNPDSKNHEDIQIVDEVAYEGLTVRNKYTLTGVMMDKATGKTYIADVKKITGEKTFVAEAENEKINIEFTINTKDLIDGHDIVVFETLTDQNGNIIAEHKDLNDEGQTIKVEAFDIPVKGDKKKTDQVGITKYDATNSKELEGAKLQIIDKNNKVVEEWISTKEQHIVDLYVGETYTLRETIAPEGYAIAEEIKFTVEDNGKVVQQVKMYDDLLPVSKAKTGDDTKMVGLCMVAVTSLVILLGVVAFSRKKEF